MFLFDIDYHNAKVTTDAPVVALHQLWNKNKNDFFLPTGSGKVKERIYKVRVIRLISSFFEGVRFLIGTLEDHKGRRSFR